MQLPFFYGWVIVAIVMIAGVLAAGVSNITMAVVLKPISEDLGWSRTLMAAAITVGSLSGGLLSPLFGPLADRFGPRVLLPLGGALVGLLAFGVSASTEPWQFYATFIPARALTESYGVHFDPVLRDEVLARVDRLGLPSYTGFVMPKLEAVYGADGAITDVRISYPCDLTAQMLEYSQTLQGQSP